MVVLELVLADFIEIGINKPLLNFFLRGFFPLELSIAFSLPFRAS